MPMIQCEFQAPSSDSQCPHGANYRWSQNRYPCGKVYYIRHCRVERGIVWCDVCWAQRIEAECNQEIRGKKAERSFWIIGAMSVVAGYGSMFLLELYLVGKLGPFTVFGGTVVSGAYFVLLIIVYAIREWLYTPPSDR
jgi:hypothetical protein